MTDFSNLINARTVTFRNGQTHTVLSAELQAHIGYLLPVKFRLSPGFPLGPVGTFTLEGHYLSDEHVTAYDIISFTTETEEKNMELTLEKLTKGTIVNLRSGETATVIQAKVDRYSNRYPFDITLKLSSGSEYTLSFTENGAYLSDEDHPMDIMSIATETKAPTTVGNWIPFEYTLSLSRVKSVRNSLEEEFSVVHYNQDSCGYTYEHEFILKGSDNHEFEIQVSNKGKTSDGDFIITHTTIESLITAPISRGMHLDIETTMSPAAIGAGLVSFTKEPEPEIEHTDNGYWTTNLSKLGKAKKVELESGHKFKVKVGDQGYCFQVDFKKLSYLDDSYTAEGKVSSDEYDERNISRIWLRDE